MNQKRSLHRATWKQPVIGSSLPIVKSTRSQIQLQPQPTTQIAVQPILPAVPSAHARNFHSSHKSQRQYFFVDPVVARAYKQFQETKGNSTASSLIRRALGGKGSDRKFALGAAGLMLLVLLVFFLTDKYLYPKKKKRQNRPKVVVLGSGWGGLAAVAELDTRLYDVTLVSPSSHFLFTPLLSAATLGLVDANSITEPVRRFLARVKGDKESVRDTTYHEGAAVAIDAAKQIVKCTGVGGLKYDVPYDKLIVAVGSVNDTYGVKGADKHCHFLKGIDDSRRVRNKIIDCFEIANSPGATESDVERLLHFVVVGGNPTSVVFTSQLHDLLDEMRVTYPNLKDKIKVTFLHAGKDHVRNTYEAKITKYYVDNEFEPIQKKCEDMKVLDEVAIKEVTEKKIFLENNETLDYGMCLWLTGTGPSPLVKDLMKQKPKEQTNQHALVTNPYLKVKGYDNIYAIGECATIDQKRLVEKWNQVFEQLDENKDGFIDPEEFKQLVGSYSRQYPQLIEYADQAEKLFAESDINKDGKLSLDEFKTVLSKVDASLTSLPATAQVAFQQGRYLGHSLNHTLQEEDVRRLFKKLDVDQSGQLDTNEIRKGLAQLRLPSTKKDVEHFLSSSDSDTSGTVDEEEFVRFVLDTQLKQGSGDWKKVAYSQVLPFRYKHLGGYEYVGYENQVTERGSEGRSILDGFGAWWMWNSIYSSRLMSTRARVSTALNYALAKIFGRDLTRN